ncbi:NAD(P)-binding protein [Lentinula raphanica]|nr:NAD(P)-binding protein [Lentinula raphanica]
MGNIPDDILTQHHARLKGKTVIVTGAGASIGRATAILFASYGSNVIVSDKNISSAEETVSAIKTIKGEAIACKCDVTLWEDIVAMYELAVREYGSVDIVVANAGVGEIGGRMMHDPRSGRPTKPLVTTIDVNLTGVLYTVHLAQHYFDSVGRPEDPSSMKCVILVGSMASWTPLSKAPIYTASKHAVLAIMRSLDVSFASRGIRIASIHPFFAGRHNLQSVDDSTSMVPEIIRLQLSGIPLTPVPRIAGAILYAASQPDPSCNGAAFWIPDGGASTFMISKEEFKPGVYDYIDSKSNATSVYVTLV